MRAWLACTPRPARPVEGLRASTRLLDGGSLCDPSAAPVHATPMLSAMDEHDVCSFVDLEDHPELTSSSRVQPLKLAPEGLPGSMRVLGDRPEDRFDDGLSNLRRKAAEVPEALRRDLDLVHELDVVL